MNNLLDQSASTAPAQQRATPCPPVAAKIATQLNQHGVCRVDHYHWLRDDTKTDPTVLAHLGAENRYSDVMLARSQNLQDTLYQEMLARQPEHQQSAPVKLQQYAYWQSFSAKAQYSQYWRAPLAAPQQPSLLVDANLRAQPHHFYRLAPLAISEDEQYICLAEDTCGDLVFDISILNLADGQFLAEKLLHTSGEVVWGNDSRHLYYVRVMPGTLQRAQVYRHQLGTSQQQDCLVYEETDPRFYTLIKKSKDRSLVMILHHHTETLAVSTLEAGDPHSAVCCVLPRQHGHRYWVEKRGNEFFMLTNWQAINFKLIKVPIDQAADPSCWQTVVAPSADGLLEDLQLFDNHLVYLRRERGSPVYRVKSLQSGDETVLQFNDQAFSAFFKDNVSMASPCVRFAYESPTAPASVIEFDLVSTKQVLLKQDHILGGFLPENYQCEHLEFTVRDQTKVPVTLVYRKDKFQRCSNPLYLEGYGAYGLNVDASFCQEQISLLDRGFVCAFAHTRGSAVLGWDWYEQGKLFNKHNTFNDFIDVTKALVAHGYAAKDKVFAVGHSAGGLLIGSVVNQAPELYKACAAHVPFVDIVTTMLDDSLPLTSGEYDEWGDPNNKACFDYMLSYSPYDQIKAQAYPHLLVTSGLYDGQVQYFEPAKWVAKLREFKTDDHQLLLQVNMHAGHTGASGRFEQYRQVAQEYAFFLSLLSQ